MDFPAWDPVLIDIPGLPIDIRWYGLMYVVAFLIAQWIFVRLARARFFPVPPEVAPDLIFYCVIGVMVGGRAGFALFYDNSLLNPLEFVKVWRGGLAFHGGLGGVAIATWLFSRKYKIAWRRTADSCAMAVTPGILAVRFANFINGELFGRVTDKATAFAMQFPTDPMAERLLHLDSGWTMRDRELCIQVAYGHQKFADVQHLLSQTDVRGQAIDWAEVQRHLDWEKIRHLTDADGKLLVPFRHPSQLYEGLGEGLLLGLLLLTLYLLTRKKPWRPGAYAIVFLFGYAVIRWSLERVRQPDSYFPGDGTVLLGMTMGQTLSTAMVVGALVMLFWPSRHSAGGAGPTAAE